MKRIESPERYSRLALTEPVSLLENNEQANKTVERNLGIHHITAISADPIGNVAFYVRFLGLRLVKKTVNFDDPNSYHLYFGDESGNPGTIMTFFLWPGARRGRVGRGQVSSIAFAVPDGALEFWKARSYELGELWEPIDGRFKDKGISLRDPDGMVIELVEAGAPGGSRQEIPGEAAITGFHSATISVGDVVPTGNLLSSIMGLEPVQDDLGRFRYQAVSGTGRYIDLLRTDGPWGQMGAGTNHHIAFRARDDQEQLQWREGLTSEGFDVTSVRDRTYFHSIYFREPGGTLFEIATDPPGFPIDEPLEQLGERLMLPEWLEPSRTEIESNLPPLS